MKRDVAAKVSFLLAICTLGVLSAAGPAAAKANVGKFYMQQTVSGTTALPECLPSDLVGTVRGTETVSGHFTETKNSLHFEGKQTFDYRVVFRDGRYVVGSAPSHFSFNATRSGQSTFTQTIHERRTIYNAAGDPIGRVMIQALTHQTYRDLNGNGQPDPGEITASVDKFFFRCQ